VERKKRDWGSTAALLCALLLAVNLWQGKRLENLERRISEAQWNLSAEIKGLESSLYAQAQEKDKLVQNWNYTSSTNMEKRCLDLTVSVVLKAWREDTAREALWGRGGHSGPRRRVHPSRIHPDQRAGGNRPGRAGHRGGQGPL